MFEQLCYIHVKYDESAITAQKIKFSIKDFFSKCRQIHSFLRIWSHLLKKSLMENFFFFCSAFSLCNLRVLYATVQLLQ